MQLAHGLLQVAVSRGARLFEAEALEFHDRVRAGFLDLASGDPKRYAVIAASAAPDQVASAIIDAVKPFVAALTASRP